MRGITITYTYSGDEAVWQNAISDFIAAIDSDPEIVGKFTYQVATADDKETRIHWGRWDSDATLSHLQAQDYFKIFAAKVKSFADEAPSAMGHDITFKTHGW